MTTTRAVLVVGAGAVGQVFGHFLASGGASVTYLVREKYRAEVEGGLELWQLSSRGQRRALPRARYDVIASLDEVRQRAFDQVYLAIPSTALTRPWLDELLLAIGEATLVNLTPGVGDREVLLAAGAAAERLISGLIGFVAYHAPLPGEDHTPPGMTVWFPLGSPCKLSGPAEPKAEVLAALSAGGLPAQSHADVLQPTAFLGGALQAFVLALEGAGWSFRELASRPRRRGLHAAIREISRIASARYGRVPLLLRVATRPVSLRVALAVLPRIAPLPLETYLRVHFTKVGAQTRYLVEEAVTRGRAAQLETVGLERLLAAVRAER